MPLDLNSPISPLENVFPSEEISKPFKYLILQISISVKSVGVRFVSDHGSKVTHLTYYEEKIFFFSEVIQLVVMCGSETDSLGLITPLIIISQKKPQNVHHSAFQNIRNVIIDQNIQYYNIDGSGQRKKVGIQPKNMSKKKSWMFTLLYKLEI